MFCHKCGRQFQDNELFCRGCGTVKRREQESVLCSSADERLAIEHYFERGFRYETIVHFLAEYHGISINVRTLKRRLSQYGLRRRNQVHSEHTVREIMKREIEGPSSLLGYRGMWNKLRTSYNVTVPRDMVMRILRELDPDASALRKARKLQRRSYVSPRQVETIWLTCMYMAVLMDFPGELCGSKYVKATTIQLFQQVFSSMQ